MATVLRTDDRGLKMARQVNDEAFPGTQALWTRQVALDGVVRPILGPF